ncbi:MAG: hypothetical protein B1H11_08495 [Desulfobacteraceae bacterium 4484_190.1]|nr:MAG: hypothetical protein B1H11_08495 [Desulfobacteraceae bacterium 4484_190.1]
MFLREPLSGIELYLHFAEKSNEEYMKIQEAIMAFSQSEKIKSGLIWVSQTLELASALPLPEKQGAERVIKALMDMIIHEIRLAKSIFGYGPWGEIEESIDKAIVMINSGVGTESVVHLTKSLSLVTTIGHRSMSFMKEEGLI